MATKGKKKSTLDDNARSVMMTWIRRKNNVKNVPKSLKELVSQAENFLATGTVYCCCETYDTYLKGGLYPVLHWCTDRNLIKGLLITNDFISSNQLGERNLVEQAIYKEVDSVNPPGEKQGSYTVMSIAAFRAIEDQDRAPRPPPEILMQEWKSWTGTRGFMVDILQSGLSCHKVKFYVKEAPLDCDDNFYYVVTTEVGITEPNDEGLFVDVMQRFRVERWLGYRTIYRKYQTIGK